MKRNLYRLAAIALAIVVLMLASGVVTIGERLGRLHPWAEGGFYLLVVLLIAIYVVRPIWRVHHAPEFPRLAADADMDAVQLRRFGLKLADGCLYIPEADARRAHQLELVRQLDAYAGDAEGLRAVVASELSLRMDGDEALGVRGINGRIRQWATTVFMVTAVSQSARFDSLSVMYLNYKMIEDIILASGFRPSGRQLMAQYIRILTTSLITYYANEVLSDMSDITPFAGGDAAADAGSWTFMGALRKLRIPGIVVGSVADGAVNALITLRIGYVTRACLVRGSSALSAAKAGRSVRREALADALKAIPAVVKDGSAAMGKGVATALQRILDDDTVTKDANATT